MYVIAWCYSTVDLHLPFVSINWETRSELSNYVINVKHLQILSDWYAKVQKEEAYMTPSIVYKQTLYLLDNQNTL